MPLSIIVLSFFLGVINAASPNDPSSSRTDTKRNFTPGLNILSANQSKAIHDLRQSHSNGKPCIVGEPGTIIDGPTGRTMRYEEYLPPGMSPDEYHNKFGSPFRQHLINERQAISSGIYETMYNGASCSQDSLALTVEDMVIGQCYTLNIMSMTFPISSTYVSSPTDNSAWIGFEPDPDSSTSPCGLASYVYVLDTGCVNYAITGTEAFLCMNGAADGFQC